jgi:hypothetical protein
MSTRLQRLALRAYPREYRRARGGEILTTLDDLGAPGRSPRQVGSLLVAGLRTRAGSHGGWTPAGIVGDGLRIGAALIVGGYALMLLLYSWQEHSHTQPQHLIVAGLWTAAALWLFGGRRSAPAVILAAAAISLAWQVRDGVAGDILLFDAAFLTGIAVTAAGATLVADRTSPPRRVSPLWLLAVVPQLLVMTGTVDTRYGVFISSTIVALSVPMIVAAVLVVPADPRPAVAGAVVLVPVLAWLTTGAVLNLYTFASPLSPLQLGACALPAVVMALSGLRGASRVAANR